MVMGCQDQSQGLLVALASSHWLWLALDDHFYSGGLTLTLMTLDGSGNIKRNYDQPD